MVQFCNEISSLPQIDQAYQRKVENIAKWYRENHEKYASLMRVEAALSQRMLDILDDCDGIANLLGIHDLGYTYDAKLAYFVVSDTLIKLILSMYCYGPNEATFMKYGFTMTEATSWMTCNATSYVMTEAIARVLTEEKKQNNCPEHHFDLMALQVERDQRNEITHRGEYARCMSAIRCYNTIRSMLVFMDPAYSDLPIFEYGSRFDLNDFLASPCGFDFENYTTVLITESVHDIPLVQRSAVANLQWNMVIDLDGYSENGGLLSAVSHNRIRKQVLDRNASRQAQHIVRHNTLWYRCGDYQDYSIKPGAITVPSYTPFRPTKSPTPIREVLSNLMQRLEDTDRPLNIVILDDREDFVQDLIGLLTQYDPSHYFITWIGLSSQDNSTICQSMFRRDRELMDQVFRYFNVPVQHFFNAVADAPDLWEPRVSMETQFTLPGENGPVEIPENIRNNLEPYFDVLYDGCENVPFDVAEKEQIAFFRGHTAGWNTIANNVAVPLKSPAEMRQITDYIRTVLGATQQDPGKRFVLVRHTSGFGGTTLARQIAWEMHKLKYPVLAVNSFDSMRVPAMLENLYDNILNTKPIVLLVDDTMREREKLFDYVKRINRRCVLLCACREKSFIRIPGAKEIPLTLLGAEQIDQLRVRFRTARQQQGFGATDWELEQRITVELNEAKMRSPFIIGLLYFEKDFSVLGYVRKAMQSASPRQKDILACLALCDQFDHKYVPVSLVKQALDIRTKIFAFPKEFPAAESLVCRSTIGNDDVFYFKHWLLSECYLNEYSGGAYSSMLAKLAEMLIDVASSAQKVNNNHLELLIHILIQCRDYDDDFSKLMMKIKTESTQRTIMRKLIDSFKDTADEVRCRIANRSADSDEVVTQGNDIMVMNLVSHAYAHLGRMYSRHSTTNFEMAEQMFRKALDFMVADNARIYHMCGTGILDRLRSQWKDVVPGNKPSAEERVSYRLSIEEATNYFDLACHHGSPDYGYPSKLELYYLYLNFLYKSYDVQNDEQLNRIPQEDRLIQGDFLRTLEEAQNIAHYEDFSDEARTKIDNYDGKFQSKILFGKFGTAISFYENQIQKFEMQNDLENLRTALRNLFFTRISKLRQDYPDDFPYGLRDSDAKKLFADINRLLNESFGMPDSYAEYRSLSTMYRYWFQFAKLTDQAVDQGLTMAGRWIDMERYFNTHSRNQSAEPFYHMVTMLYLSVLDNPLAHKDMSKARDMHAALSRMESTRHSPRYKIRDVFVNGLRMGRLRDVSRYRGQEEILGFLQFSTREFRLSRPMPVEARISDVSSHAKIEIYSPTQWVGLSGSMVIGKESGNTISSNQINNRICFLMGFGYDGIEALSATARDLSNEKFDLDRILSNRGHNKRSAPGREIHRPRRLNQIAVTPGRGAQDIIYADGKIIGLFGQCNEYPVRFLISDLERFGSDVLTPYGGTDVIIKKMQNLETIPCVPAKELIDPEKCVDVSMYDTRQSLYSLLGLSEPPKMEVDSIHEQENTGNTDAPLEVTIPKRQAVKIIVEDADAQSPTVAFRYKDVNYKGCIQGKITNNQRKILKQSKIKKGQLNALVMGEPDKKGYYSIKIIY